MSSIPAYLHILLYTPIDTNVAIYIIVYSQKWSRKKPSFTATALSEYIPLIINGTKYVKIAIQVSINTKIYFLFLFKKLYGLDIAFLFSLQSYIDAYSKSKNYPK